MRILVILTAIATASAQTTFEYLSDYPQGCADRGPASEYVGGSYNYGYLAVCDIPDVRPPGNFVPPLPGGSYVDSNFGYRVRVSAPIGYIPTYSTPSSLSAKGRYLATGGLEPSVGGDSVGGTTDIWDVTSAKRVKKTAGASQDWGFWWHPTEDDAYFTIDRGSRILRKSVTGGASALVLDLSATGLTIHHGGTGDVAPDLWLSFGAGPAGAQADRVCAAPLDGSNQIYCRLFVDIGLSGWDFSLMSKGVDSGTGLRYVIVETGGFVLAVNRPAKQLDLVYRVSGVHWNHADTMQGPDGKQYVFGTHGGDMPQHPDVNGNTYGGSIHTFWPLGVHDPNMHKKWKGDGGAAIPVLRVSWYSPVISGAGSTHYNCAKSAPVCVVGHRDDAISSDGGALPARPFQMEAITITMEPDGAFVVRRLAKIRSLGWNKYGNDYYSYPMCSISGDGVTRVACKSNFGLMPCPVCTAEAGASVRAETHGGTRRVITIDLDHERGERIPRPDRSGVGR